MEEVVLSVPPSSEALAWDSRGPKACTSSFYSFRDVYLCTVPMLAHVWDLTLKACHSAKVAEKTLSPESKMQNFSHLAGSMIQPKGKASSCPQAQPKGDSEDQQGAAQSNLPEPTSSDFSVVSTTLRSWRFAQGLAYHSRQQSSVLPSPLTNA